MMPVRLFLVRHGESEANVIRADESLSGKYNEVPDAELRLTPRGVEQARAAGEWLRQARTGFAGNLEGFVSPFVRAKETAGNLGLQLAWLPYPFLTERSWGDYWHLDQAAQKARSLRKRRDPLYTGMPSGHSISDLATTNYLFFGMLHREHSNNTVVAVCHGERMLMMRYQLERMTDESFRTLMRSRHTGDQVRNCQIVEYTRQNPETGATSTHLDWMRSFCPWDIREKDLIWKRIQRKPHTDEDLLAYAERHPRLLS